MSWDTTRKSQVVEPIIYSFTGTVERFQQKGGYYFIRFPYNVLEEFGTRSSVRVIVNVNGIELDRALIPDGNGEHYLILSSAIRKKVGAVLGEELHVELFRNPDPDTLHLPAELEAVFEIEPMAKERFETRLTIGTRRGICHWISSARREETRTKRALEMMNRLLSDTFEMGGRKIPMN